MTTVKCLLNSVVSTTDAKFMTMDISDFYLNTPMDRYEYMRIPITAIPDCIMEEYKLEPLVHNGFVVVELRKGIYGFPQAGILANIQLKKHLADNDYHPAHTAGLFKHKTRPVTFSLCVDDFGVKYVGKENAQHLEQVLRQKISNHNRLDRFPLRRTYLTMELQVAHGRSLHARLHRQDFGAFPASEPNKTPTLSSRLAGTSVRCTHSAHRSDRHIAASATFRCAIPPTSHWHSPVLCTGDRQHNVSCDWFDCFRSKQRHRCNNARSHSPFKLLRDTPRCCHSFSRQRHGVEHSFGCLLPIGKSSQVPHRRIFLFKRQTRRRTNSSFINFDARSTGLCMSSAPS
jgi:hypothetical protein